MQCGLCKSKLCRSRHVAGDKGCTHLAMKPQTAAWLGVARQPHVTPPSPHRLSWKFSASLLLQQEAPNLFMQQPAAANSRPADLPNKSQYHEGRGGCSSAGCSLDQGSSGVVFYLGQVLGPSAAALASPGAAWQRLCPGPCFVRSFVSLLSGLA